MRSNLWTFCSKAPCPECVDGLSQTSYFIDFCLNCCSIVDWTLRLAFDDLALIFCRASPLTVWGGIPSSHLNIQRESFEVGAKERSSASNGLGSTAETASVLPLAVLSSETAANVRFLHLIVCSNRRKVPPQLPPLLYADMEKKQHYF